MFFYRTVFGWHKTNTFFDTAERLADACGMKVGNFLSSPNESYANL